MTRKQPLELVEVFDEGFVAAGRTVPFPIGQSTTLLALTPEQADLARQGLIRTMTVHGPSLQDIGLYEGDKLVCKKAYSKKEVGHNTVCIVYVPALGDVVAKKIRFEGDWIILRSCNKAVPDMSVQRSEVDIRGIVIQLVRKPDPNGRFDRGYDDDIPY